MKNIKVLNMFIRKFVKNANVNYLFKVSKILTNVRSSPIPITEMRR